jgi:hypothetical protein
MKVKIIVFLLLVMSKLSLGGLLSIGPMVNYNFGGNKNYFSYAFELAVWNYDLNYSVDLALEFVSKNRAFFYSEIQAGGILAGISLGPVFELMPNDINLGIQSTLWVNCFFGIDVRLRYINSELIKVVGIYGKLPIQVGEITSIE